MVKEINYALAYVSEAVKPEDFDPGAWLENALSAGRWDLEASPDGCQLHCLFQADLSDDIPQSADGIAKHAEYISGQLEIDLWGTVLEVKQLDASSGGGLICFVVQDFGRLTGHDGSDGVTYESISGLPLSEIPFERLPEIRRFIDRLSRARAGNLGSETEADVVVGTDADIGRIGSAVDHELFKSATLDLSQGTPVTDIVQSLYDSGWCTTEGASRIARYAQECLSDPSRALR